MAAARRSGRPRSEDWWGPPWGVAHLALNGSYESLKRLVVAPLPVLSQWPPLRVRHTLLVYLLVSGGARLSQAKHFAWRPVQGLLDGCAGLSAISLRHWLVAVVQHAGEKVTVRHSDGREERITRLQDYQEESVAQRLKRRLIEARAIYLDDYINAVFRREPIVRAKHGIRRVNAKAFRQPAGHPRPYGRWRAVAFAVHLSLGCSIIFCAIQMTHYIHHPRGAVASRRRVYQLPRKRS